MQRREPAGPFTEYSLDLGAGCDTMGSAKNLFTAGGTQMNLKKMLAAGLVLGVLAARWQRVKEIQKGEADDAKNY